jgi:hypothetical protein
MLKTITPMSTLKAHFLNLEKALKTNGIDYKVWELNKREEQIADKYNEYSFNKKRIVSDFLRIFDLNDFGSIAFSFDFQGLEKEDHSVYVTYKIGGEIHSSKNQTLETMKSSLKLINKTLNSSQDKVLTSSFIELFVGETIRGKELTEEEIAEVKSAVQVFVQNKREEYEIDNNKLKEISLKHDKARDNIRKELEGSEEKKTFESLKKQLDEANRKLLNKRHLLNKKYDLNNINKEAMDIRKIEANSRNRFEKYKTEALKISLRKNKV